MTDVIDVGNSFYFDAQDVAYKSNQQILGDLIDGSDEYKEKVLDMLTRGNTRLNVNLRDIRAINPSVYTDIISNPIKYVGPFQKALQNYISSNADQWPHLAIADVRHYCIGFHGLEQDINPTPRQLTSQRIGTLVCVEGIVTRCSLVKAKVEQSVHYCEATNKKLIVRYHDHVSLVGEPTSSVYPTKDEDGNPLSAEFGLSTYFNTQTLGLQEMPEQTPSGLIPCSINVVMDKDLVDSAKPGDRVRITGVFRALPHYSGRSNNGVFNTIFIALHTEKMLSKQKSILLHGNDEQYIRALSKHESCLDILCRSIAPSIFGQIDIKKGLLLLLLGGVERELKNKSHLRGDINILMIGDPSTAKSQLLRFIMHLAPLAINTTGRGSSGVGLTAAVVSDKDTGEKRLEAGAMVLADRGIVCIDEFDKMSDHDRVAIHEVMEQQTVTISKAGIQMSLNSRCSVLAAANPVYGQYQPEKAAHINIGLQDSILSRFDLIYVVIDKIDDILDRHIATRVIENHMVRGGGHTSNNNSSSSSNNNDAMVDYNPEVTVDTSQTSTQVFTNKDYDAHLLPQGKTSLQRTKRGARTTKEVTIALDKNNDPLYTKKVDAHDKMAILENSGATLTIDFLRKYINYAKQIEPRLSDDAIELIANKFASRGTQKRATLTTPLTARSIETLIRLSTAFAKATLSEIVTSAHAQQAIDLFSEALKKPADLKAEYESKKNGGNNIPKSKKSDDSNGNDEDGNDKNNTNNNDDNDDDSNIFENDDDRNFIDDSVESKSQTRHARRALSRRGPKKSQYVESMADDADESDDDDDNGNNNFNNSDDDDNNINESELMDDDDDEISLRRTKKSKKVNINAENRSDTIAYHANQVKIKLVDSTSEPIDFNKFVQLVNKQLPKGIKATAAEILAFPIIAVATYDGEDGITYFDPKLV